MNRWNATTPFRQGLSSRDPKRHVAHGEPDRVRREAVRPFMQPTGWRKGYSRTDLNGRVPTPTWRENGINVRKQIFPQFFQRQTFSCNRDDFHTR